MRKIKLSRGKVALVDDRDYDWLSKFSWHVHKGAKCRTYHVRTLVRGPDKKPKDIFMHQLIIDRMYGGYQDEWAEMKLECDHINRSGLDNRRNNLRLATHSMNMLNRECRNRRPNV
jgi:hypothetical protein